MTLPLHRAFILGIFSACLLILFSCSKAEPDLPASAVGLKSVMPTSTIENPPATSLAFDIYLGTTTPEKPGVTNLDMLIVYEKSGNLWVSERGISSQLTSSSKDSRPKLSDDGTMVAFQRREELWIIDINGQNERKLFGETGKAPLQLEFVNDDKNVLFTTRNSNGEPLYDLNIGNIGRGESIGLLSAGKGGAFVPAPDSDTLALVQPDKIFAYNLTSGAIRALYQFQSIKSESGLFLPPIAWLENGYGFKTIIPSEDGKSNSFLFIPANGEKPARLAEFSSLPPSSSGFFISPDGSKVLYLKKQGENLELHAIDASTTDRSYLKKSKGKLGIIGWSPDSKIMIIWLDEPGSVWALSSDTISKFSDAVNVTNVYWVNPEIYLFKSELELHLMTLGKQSVVIDNEVSGSYDAQLLR